MIPLFSEAVLMLGAFWLTISLHRIIWTEGAVFPFLSFALIAAVYAGLASYARAHEMFMPRSVVLVGVGTLAVLAIIGGLTVTLDAFLLGGTRRVSMAALVLIPLALFLARCALIFREARYTPSVNEHFLKSDVRSERMKEWRAKFRFWLD